MLSTEDGIGVSHHLLDVRVTHPRANSYAPMLGDDFWYHVRADQVVEHRGSGVLVEHRCGNQGGGERPRDRPGLLIHKEHTVGVPVECQAHVRPGVQHGSLQIDQIVRLDRVGRVVRERAIELGVKQVDVEGKPIHDQRND
jgi:hypothetical protein